MNTNGTPQYLDGRWPILVCKSAACGAPIVWARHRSGSRMPVDAHAVPDGAWRLLDEGGPDPVLSYAGRDPVVIAAQAAGADMPLHDSHFATCAQADQFRRNRR
jgi:hypothetical protein